MLLWSVVLLTLLSQLISSEDTLINETQEDEVDIKQSTAADNVTELNSTNETFDNSSRENVPVGIQSRDAYSERHENLALRKKAIQSSTLNWYSILGVANRAVDGNINRNFDAGSCTHTLNTFPAWWAVDLGHETTVGRVRITNRGDCCADRLANFYIGLTNVSPWTTAPRLEESSICKYYIGFPPGGIPTDIYCEPDTEPGRYLFVLQGKEFPLTICELEAYLR